MPSFEKLQKDFIRRLRTPESVATSDVGAERADIYRQLLLEKYRALVAKSFPLACNLVPPVIWSQLVVDFIRDVDVRTPYFYQLSQVFLDYVTHARQEVVEDYPFLVELMHFEWAEMALSISEAELPSVKVAAWQTAPLMVSPLAWLLLYCYPVHEFRKAGHALAARAAPVCLIMWRDRQDQLAWREVTARCWALVEYLQENPGLTGQQLVAGVKPYIVEGAADFSSAAGDLLQNLLADEIIVAAS